MAWLDRIIGKIRPARGGGASPTSSTDMMVAAMPSSAGRGRIIVFTSGKGGVGKTTISSTVASLLAQRKKKVLVIDLDTGLRNLDLVMGVSGSVAYNLYDVLENGVDWRQSIVEHPQIPGLSVIVTDQAREKESINLLKFQGFAYEVAKHFDQVIIDCPAGIEHGFRVAISPADEAVIVTTPEQPSMRAAAQIARLLERQKVAPVSCLLNRVYMDFMESGVCATREQVELMVGVPVVHLIPMDRVIMACGHNGLPLALWPNASEARDALQGYVDKLLGNAQEKGRETGAVRTSLRDIAAGGGMER